MTSWKVVRIKGESEPWWFFPDWQKDISEENEFQTENEAFRQFIILVQEGKHTFDHFKEKKNTVAFWNEGDKVFCEACDDDLQLYHGLILMKDDHPKEFSEEEKETLRSSLEA
jgi:hypothetical protein